MKNQTRICLRDRGEVDQRPDGDHQCKHGQDRANAEPDDPLGHA